MVRVAVIGVGHLGKQHARLYAELEGVELAGIVDILEPRAQGIASLYKTAAFTNYRDILGKVDAVSLAIPTSDHARVGVDLLEHGLDVLVEKPIASAAEEARSLIEAAARNKQVLWVSLLFLTHPFIAPTSVLATWPQFYVMSDLSAFSESTGIPTLQ